MRKASFLIQVKGKTMKCIDLQRQFGDRYRIGRDPAGGRRNKDPWLWTIPCKYGEIYPYGGEAMAALVTAIRVASQMRCWQELEVIQDADDAVVFRFHFQHFDRVADRLGARRRRRYSLETLERMKKRAANARNSVAKPNRERVQESRHEGSDAEMGYQPRGDKIEAF